MFSDISCSAGLAHSPSGLHWANLHTQTGLKVQKLISLQHVCLYSLCTAKCSVSWMACPSLLLGLGLSQWGWPAWRRTKAHVEMLLVQADRVTPGKHCTSNTAWVQPGKRWFCLHSFWADHPDLQGEWGSTWLWHSLSLQEEERNLPECRNHFRYSSVFCTAPRGSCWILPFQGS